MSSTKKTLIATGLIFGVISVFLLYNEPDIRPLEDRTFSGQSESEIQFIKEIKNKNFLGFLFLGISFFLQLLGLLVEDIVRGLRWFKSQLY